jgi:hypothetical protein
LLYFSLLRLSLALLWYQVDLDHYPPTEPLLDIVKRWNPDDSEHLPNPFKETLQVRDVGI